MLVQLDSDNIVRSEFIAKITTSGGDSTVTLFDGTTTLTIANLNAKEVFEKLENAGATTERIQVIQG